MSKSRKDKVTRLAGHRSLKESAKFRRSVRSAVDEDAVVDSKIYGWREGGTYRWSNSRYFLKFFRSRVGQKWNNVISELFADIKDPHFRKEALAKVEVNTYYNANGDLAFHPVGYRGILRLVHIIKDQYDVLYVEDGILKRHQRQKRLHDYYRNFKANGYYDGKDLYIRENDIWFRIDEEYIKFQSDYGKMEAPFSVAVRRNEHTKDHPHKIINLYLERYATKKKQLSKKELKKLRASHPYLDQDVTGEFNEQPTRYFYL